MKNDNSFAAIAVILVLFTTMINPWVLIGLAAIIVIGYYIYSFLKKEEN